MKPDVETLTEGCPGVAREFLQEHLSRLGESYFSRFSKDEVILHLRDLAEITPEDPVRVELNTPGDGTLDCTVLAYDYPWEFSLITGILAGMGYGVFSGDVFTYERAAPGTPMGRRGRRHPALPLKPDPLKRRRIIDHFTGALDTPLPFENWAAELREQMRLVIGMLEAGDEASVTEAKRLVNEMVVRRLSRPGVNPLPVLYPVEIEVDNTDASHTRLKVVSQDTPAFLYALSNALSLRGILIEQVRIRTLEGRIEDSFDLTDDRGGGIDDPALIEGLKLSALLTKQFTYFLEKAPNPYAALSRFEKLQGEILARPEKGEWLEILTSPEILQDLAQLLGASDYLWEDFVRLQYETLLPMLEPQGKRRRFSTPSGALSRTLRRTLEDCPSYEDKRRRLNEFKDREIFLIDLDHILNPGVDFRVLSARLTRLAETVVSFAARIVYEMLLGEFGTPRTIGGLPARFAVLGLGKLGGAALGYASDIELLFVYSDSGESDGPKTLRNAEFFDRLVREVKQFIRAKREGIFQVDLRLRPHGNAGPLACSLEQFCSYYGQRGQAHAYERLALTRLRAVGGDPSLGRLLERLRDEIVYFSDDIDIQSLHELRERQFREKTGGGRLNAKFSPGGLVDLEYGVQILQVLNGRNFPQLMTPGTHEALNRLTGANILTKEESLKLVGAYDFLRNLINGMRMLRGSARDLFLPPADSLEYEYLARRMGYARGGPLDQGQQLRIDFETHTAGVRLFVERYFGRESLPAPGAGTVVDLVLSDEMPADSRRNILSNAGFTDTERAYVNVKKLAGEGSRRETFARLALTACDILGQLPDPDRALNNWERFIHVVASPEFHYSTLLSQPMRLEILLQIFSGSQFLADTLVRHPGFLDWLMTPNLLGGVRSGREMVEELGTLMHRCLSHLDWLNSLRRFRRREMLRIGTRDMGLGAPTVEITGELSALADSILKVDLENVRLRLAGGGEEAANAFCVMALGKLGGNELNYSSDIDLLGIRDDRGPLRGETGGDQDPKSLSARVMEALRSDLSVHTEEGYAYRVDLRLRPFGRSGELVPSFSGLIRYYRDKASLWEIQAALKMRPVAGDPGLGRAFIEELRPLILRKRDPGVITASIEKMRNSGLASSSKASGGRIDVKSGPGGLRDIEFLVQGLQLIHAPESPDLLEANTLRALQLLGEGGILPQVLVDRLGADYVFLRRVEHCLQILEDRQIHTLPGNPAELDALAVRIVGTDATADLFMDELSGCLTRTREAYGQYLIKGK